MSTKRDYARDHARQRVRDAKRPTKPRYDGPVLVDQLEPMIRAATAAKLAGRWYSLPKDLEKHDARRVWNLAVRRVRSELASRGGPRLT